MAVAQDAPAVDVLVAVIVCGAQPSYLSKVNDDVAGPVIQTSFVIVPLPHGLAVISEIV